MGVSAVQFSSAGQSTSHLIPGAYSRLNYESEDGGGVSSNNGVILGDSDGGEPDTLLSFDSPTEARASLRGGNLLSGVLHAFSPGNSLVPQTVHAMRVNLGTQSAASLSNGAADQIDLLSWDWGVHTNKLKRMFSAGSTKGTHKIQFKFGSNTVETHDNITHPSFSLEYIGAGTACTVAINAALATLATTVVGGVAADTLNVPFSTFKTVSELVDYLNSNANYQAVLLAGDGDELTANLDDVTGINILSTDVDFNSDLYEIMLICSESQYIYSATHPAETASRLVPAVDTDWVYFTGGTLGATTAAAYSAALLVLESENIQMISTISSDEAVHLLIQDHCMRMSETTGRRERTAIVGGATGETIAATVQRAQNLNSELVNLAYPYFTHYDPIDTTNGIIDCSPAMYACKLLGQEIAVAINEPLTNKQVDVLSWGVTLTPSDQEKLIQAGVTCGAKTDDGDFITVRAVTTFQGNMLQENERSMMREALYMARDLRASFKKDIGRPSSVVSVGTIEAILKTKATEWYNLGLIVSDGTHDLVWGIVLTDNGDNIVIEYHTNLTAPRNFIFATANLHVVTSLSVTL